MDVVLTHIESINYVYFNSKDSLKNRQILESELALELNQLDLLVKLKNENLKINQYYLIFYGGKLHRAILFSKTSAINELSLIDTGEKISFSGSMENNQIYVLPTRYYKFHSFAFHCRLVAGFNLEQHMSNDEKTQLKNVIRLLQNKCKIKNV